jgi:hypothetical protein
MGGSRGRGRGQHVQCGKPVFERAILLGLLPNFLRLPLQLAQQHRIQHLIPQALHLPIRGMCRQIRADLGDFFGDQTALNRPAAVVERFLAAEGDRAEPQELASGSD